MGLGLICGPDLGRFLQLDPKGLRCQRSECVSLLPQSAPFRRRTMAMPTFFGSQAGCQVWRGKDRNRNTISFGMQDVGFR